MTDTMTPTPDEQDTQAPEETDATEAQAPEEQAPETQEMPMSSTGIPSIPEEKPKGIKGKIKQIADDFVIPISEPAIDEWAKVLKDGNTDAFKKYAEQIAQGMYPTFAPQIAMGLPTRVLLDPYIRVAEQTLGGIPQEPNWSDPKWAAALQGGMDEKTGRPVPMTLDQWGKYIMQDPAHGWDKSPQAHSRADAFSKALNSAFGNRSM